jgi:hypothetical protein
MSDPDETTPTVAVPEWLVHRILAESIDQPLPRETWDALDALCCSPPRLLPFNGEVEGLDDGSPGPTES